MENNTNKYQMFWFTNNMINNLNIQSYEEAIKVKEILSKTLSENQIIQLKLEVNDLAKQVLKKLKSSESFNSFKGDKINETVAQIISKGQNFVEDFLQNKPEALKELSKNPYNEYFKTIMPNSKISSEYENEIKKDIRNINKQIEMVKEKEELIETFKRDYKKQAESILEVLKMVERKELKGSFDFPKFKKEVKELEKKAKFISPYIKDLESVSDVTINVEKYLIELKREEALLNEGLEDIKKEFGEKYQFSYNNNDLESIIKIRREIDRKKEEIPQVKKNRKNSPFSEMKPTPFD